MTSKRGNKRVQRIWHGKNIKDPIDFLCLTLLDDVKNEPNMWIDFQEEFDTDRDNWSIKDITIWVMDWLYKNTKGGKG